MSKEEKIFKPEDFDKPGSSGGKWKKPLGIAALLAVLGGGGYGTYALLNEDKPQPSQTEIAQPASTPSDSVSTDSINIAKSDSTGIASEDTQKTDDALGTKQEGKSNEKSPKSDIPAIQTDLSGTIEENAKRVIRGDFGNGQERKDKLGADYRQIQDKVNEMYRKGDFYM